MSLTTWFGEYEILRKLRVGGMATLYLGRRHGAAGFSRLTAIKVVRPHLLEQPLALEMFIDEARISACISHPNVVHVEALGEVDGLHFLAMEYLDGCSVSELLACHRDTPLAPELVAGIILDAAKGLHAAHETCGPDGQHLEIVHRDISPSNIFITVDGSVKVIDFGIAKAKNRIAETEAGFSLKGKYRYVAPEQARPGSVDRRTDIFSLGIVCWEMLTGTRLFSDDAPYELFNRLAETNVRRPSELRANIPPALDELVLQMLRHDPADRPRTAHEVCRKLVEAMPAAASRDPAELVALVKRVRDQRDALQAESTTGLATPRPTGRLPSNVADTDYRIELIPTPVPTPPPNGPDPASVHPVAPTSRARRWALPLGTAGVLLAAAFFVMWIRSPAPPAEDRSAVEAPRPVVTPEPARPVITPPVIAPPPAPPVRAAITEEIPPDPVRPARISTPAPARAPRRIAVAPARPPARTSAPTDEPVGPPRAAAKVVKAGKVVIVGDGFDDETNTAATKSGPVRKKTIKNTVIVTDFQP